MSDKALSSLTQGTPDTGDYGYSPISGNSRKFQFGTLPNSAQSAFPGYLDLTEIAEPSSPAANVGRLYAYDESAATRIAYKDSAGTVRKVASTSAATTDNAVPRYDGTTGLLQDTSWTIDDNDLLTVDLGLTEIDGAAWSQATVARLGDNLSLVGTATPGSANEFGLVIHTHVPSTAASANYQKSAALFIGRTADVSNAPTLTKDIVGLDRRGYIASTNTQGRAWGGVDFAYIEPGGDGLLIGTEIDVYNNGSDQSLVDQVDSKYGINLVPFIGPVTAGIYFTTHSGGSYHNCMYADPSVIETGGMFARLVGVFEVDKSGNIMTNGGIRVGFTGTPGAADRIEIGDGTHYIELASGTTPQWLVDTSDALQYNRTANAFVTVHGGTSAVVLSAAAIRPAVNDAIALGSSAEQFSDLFLAAGGTVRVNNVQVLTTQGAAVADVAGTADTTYGANEVTMINSLRDQLNALLARCRAHGLIAT